MRMDGESVFALDPAAPIVPQVHARLRDAIIRGELAPGTALSEAEIARGCAVSRQPVREAFIRLAGEGLLEILPQRGSIVSRIDYDAVLDARFLREAIEADIVAILARTPDAAVMADLRRQIDAQAATADPAEFIRRDEAFHRLLATAAGKKGAFRLIEGLKSQMDRVRFLSLGGFRLGRLVAQHAALVDRIEAGDSAGANRAIRLHLREILADLPGIRAAHPQFFNRPDAALPPPVTAPVTGGDDTP